jgi:hypothetical protein
MLVRGWYQAWESVSCLSEEVQERVLGTEVVQDTVNAKRLWLHILPKVVVYMLQRESFS